MFQRIKMKLFIGGVLGVGHAFLKDIAVKPIIGLSANVCFSTDKTSSDFGTDCLYYTAAYSTIAMLATKIASPVLWKMYKEIYNHLYDESIIDSFISDSDEYVNPDEAGEDDIPQLEQAIPEEEENIENNSLQARLDEAKFDSSLPNGMMDVSTRDVLNKPRVLIPCGHSHSADQIKHFDGKCPCCRGFFSRSVPNHNLRQILPEVVDMLIDKTEKKKEAKPIESSLSFIQVKDQLSREHDSSAAYLP